MRVVICAYSFVIVNKCKIVSRHFHLRQVNRDNLRHLSPSLLLTTFSSVSLFACVSDNGAQLTGTRLCSVATATALINTSADIKLTK